MRPLREFLLAVGRLLRGRGGWWWGDASFGCGWSFNRCDDDDGDETVEKEVSGERSGCKDAKEINTGGPQVRLFYTSRGGLLITTLQFLNARKRVLGTYLHKAILV